jgi:hypothetical protein
MSAKGISQQPNNQLPMDESLLGWRVVAALLGGDEQRQGILAERDSLVSAFTAITIVLSNSYALNLVAAGVVVGTL